MPKYHVTLRKEYSPDLPGTRITALYEKGKDKKVALQSADLFEEGEKKLHIGNSEGSLIVVDPTREGINKIHIGELIVRNPHVEKNSHSGEEGPRADLNQWDIHYARLRLAELEKWRDPEYREKLRARYSKRKWYTVKPRVAQLNISPSGLEEQIRLLGEHIAQLDEQPDKTYFSNTASVVEERCEAIKKKIDRMAQEELFIASAKKHPKMACAPELVELARRVQKIIHPLFGRVAELTDPETVAKYWKGVWAWEKL